MFVLEVYIKYGTWYVPGIYLYRPWARIDKRDENEKQSRLYTLQVPLWKCITRLTFQIRFEMVIIFRDSDFLQSESSKPRSPAKNVSECSRVVDVIRSYMEGALT